MTGHVCVCLLDWPKGGAGEPAFSTDRSSLGVPPALMSNPRGAQQKAAEEVWKVTGRNRGRTYFAVSDYFAVFILCGTITVSLSYCCSKMNFTQSFFIHFPLKKAWCWFLMSKWGCTILAWRDSSVCVSHLIHTKDFYRLTAYDFQHLVPHKI